MTGSSGRGTVTNARDHARQDEHIERGRHATIKVPLGEYIWIWLLRLALPAVLGLCVQLISWMWFNNAYRLDAWSIAGGVLIALVVVSVAVWAWHSWLPLGREMQSHAEGTRLQLRHVVLVLLAFAAVAGYVGLNRGDNAPRADAQLSSDV